MRRLDSTVVTVVTLIGLAACGRDADIAADDVGTVCAASAGGRTVALSALLGGGDGASGQAWLRVRRQNQLTREGAADGESRQKVRLTSPEVVTGSQARTEEYAVVFRRAADEAASELARGSAVVVVRPPSSASTARVVASLRSDGSVAFLGECAARHLTAPYERFVAKRHDSGDARSGADLFQALAIDAALMRELRDVESPPVPTPVPWEARAPKDRVIDPDGSNPPPAAVMKTLKPHVMHFAYPAAWRSFEGSIVTFVPDVGWNAALPLSIDSDEPSVLAYASATKPLEIWVVPAPAGVDRPLARLAVIDAADLAAVDDVYVEARIDATSLDDLVRQAKGGATVFVMRSP